MEKDSHHYECNVCKKDNWFCNDCYKLQRQDAKEANMSEIEKIGDLTDLFKGSFENDE